MWWDDGLVRQVIVRSIGQRKLFFDVFTVHEIGPSREIAFSMF